MPAFTAWHRIAGVKLHHSLNHVLCHCPQIQIWPFRWPPQTAAARNASELIYSDTQGAQPYNVSVFQ